MFSVGAAAKSNASSVLSVGNRAAFSRRSAARRSRSISSSSHSCSRNAEVVDVLRRRTGAATFSHSAVHRRQLQRLQVVLQQHRALGLGLLHGATPAVRLA